MVPLALDSARMARAMRPFRLRRDLQRARINGFALPLGWTPGGIEAPDQGYTIDYNPGQGDEPDSYSFYVVVSHERVQTILERLFQFLPERVHGIVEFNVIGIETQAFEQHGHDVHAVAGEVDSPKQRRFDPLQIALVTRGQLRGDAEDLSETGIHRRSRTAHQFRHIGVALLRHDG